MTDTNQKLAVVLMNIGGPSDAAAVRPFLFNFFMDKNIIPLPVPFRYLLAKWISFTRGGGPSKEAYDKLGGGSPLLVNTQAQALALEKMLQQQNPAVKVFVCMRYWHPRASQVVQDVTAFAPDKIVLLPLYPQFSATTSFSAMEEWRKEAAKAGLNVETCDICCYPTHSGFVEASADLIHKTLEISPNKVRLLFSAHGLPQKNIKQGDPYQWQCEQTAQAIVRRLNVPHLDWKLCYQSKVGRLPWTEPSFDTALEEAADDKVAVVVYPMAFVSEHVETLVELDIDARAHAQLMGIPYFALVPTVGTNRLFIEGLRDLALSAATGVECERACPGRFGKCFRGEKNG